MKYVASLLIAVFLGVFSATTFAQELNLVLNNSITAKQDPNKLPVPTYFDVFTVQSGSDNLLIQNVMSGKVVQTGFVSGKGLVLKSSLGMGYYVLSDSCKLAASDIHKDTKTIVVTVFGTEGAVKGKVKCDFNQLNE